MHMPSDSWGKLGGKGMEAYIKQYLDNGDLFTPIGNTQELQFLAGELFKPSWYENKSRPEILTHILEGLKMPVTNPKTGEQDYVDVSLVNKIVIDSEYIEDMKSNEKIKVDFTLSEKNGDVSIHASNKQVALEKVEVIKLQKFEEMLFKAINEVKDQRLEEVPEFKGILGELVVDFIESSRLEQKHYARLDSEYQLTTGIGIIRDTKTNQDIGTFEEFYFLYERNQRVAIMDGIVLSGRALEDLKEQERFEISFYSLENNTVYSVIGGNSSSITADNSRIVIKKFDLLTEAFGHEHKRLQTAINAQKYKKNLEGIDKSHPLYDTKFQEFRESRLAILEESRNKQKEEQLVNQFADIDLDFGF